MSSEQSYNVALVGLGMVSGTYVDALAKIKSPITLKGVLSSRTETAEKFIGEHYANSKTAPQIYADVEAIAADADIDFVILTTPPDARDTGTHIQDYGAGLAGTTTSRVCFHLIRVNRTRIGMTNTRNVAIIGAGIGREHLQAYQQLPARFRVLTLCDLEMAVVRWNLSAPYIHRHVRMLQCNFH